MEFIVFYFLLSWSLSYCLIRLARRFARSNRRFLFSLIKCIFLTPTIIVGGHGLAPVPAWLPIVAFGTFDAPVIVVSLVLMFAAFMLFFKYERMR